MLWVLWLLCLVYTLDTNSCCYLRNFGTYHFETVRCPHEIKQGGERPRILRRSISWKHQSIRKGMRSLCYEFPPHTQPTLILQGIVFAHQRTLICKLMLKDFLNLRPKPTCCNQLLHQVSTTNKMPWKLGAERLQLRSELDEAREEAEGRRLEARFKPHGGGPSLKR